MSGKVMMNKIGNKVLIVGCRLKRAHTLDTIECIVVCICSQDEIASLLS